MLKIKELYVNTYNNIEVIKDFNLQVNSGEVHVIMGPNGSGKSTISKVIAGHPDYKVISGSIYYNDSNLSTLTTEEIAWRGIFLSQQYPVSIPGVTNMHFLKTATNAIRSKQGKNKYDAIDFIKIVKEKMAILNMSDTLLYRDVNDGFSGGEKKHNEILQMLLLKPNLAILDETDSGLDIDALKTIGININNQRTYDCAIIIITHYQRLLDHVKPDYVHVMRNGKIVKSGNSSLALELEKQGYDAIN